jgi:hypothetical protein
MGVSSSGAASIAQIPIGYYDAGGTFGPRCLERPSHTGLDLRADEIVFARSRTRLVDVGPMVRTSTFPYQDAM